MQRISKKSFSTIIVFAICFIPIFISTANSAENDYSTIKFSRDLTSFSSMNDEYISGIFSIEGSCAVNMKWIALSFNNSVQKNQSGLSLTFKFSTDDYTEGFYEIQLFGETQEGLMIESVPLTLRFKHRNLGMMALIVSISIIVVIAAVAVNFLKKKKNSNPSIEDIKIQ